MSCDNNNNKKHLEVLFLFYNGDDEPQRLELKVQTNKQATWT
jgi:hypothetical protein